MNILVTGGNGYVGNKLIQNYLMINIKCIH